MLFSSHSRTKQFASPFLHDLRRSFHPLCFRSTSTVDFIISVSDRFPLGLFFSIRQRNQHGAVNIFIIAEIIHPFLSILRVIPFGGACRGLRRSAKALMQKDVHYNFCRR
ncbi:unnamed protein product [Vicia faba]|uniref:Uncharacterized protein n=1 Tax=Vicia faba TaxID=3906 RepID=A0AAV0ZS09_VICFA|nr:unnamed protein product [Vicia faba]